MNLFDVKMELDRIGFNTNNQHSIEHNGDLEVYDNGKLVAKVFIQEGESRGTEYANSFVVEGSNGSVEEIETDDPEDVVELVRSFN